MDSLVGQNDLALLFRLVVAHLIVDFLLQKDLWLKQRSKKSFTSYSLYLHGALAGILAYLFAGRWDAIWLPFAIFVSHVLLDGLKATGEDTTLSFLLDQVGHLIIILVCWILLIGASIPEIMEFLVSRAADVKLWILITSYFAAIWPAGVLIRKMTEPWRKQMGVEDSGQGLEKAGLWIGCLERILILTFFLLDHLEAIGFLIAAKSVFRFGEIRSASSRKETEYFLIGTMISFVIGIALGLFASWIVR